jgi:hypothetical protein
MIGVLPWIFLREKAFLSVLQNCILLSLRTAFLPIVEGSLCLLILWDVGLLVTGGPRIELEQIGDKTVIHAYGLGARGFETSWGVAHKVLTLLNEKRVVSE